MRVRTCFVMSTLLVSLTIDTYVQDKDKVAEYKAQIKDQLSRAGLIRGQPRAAYLQHANNAVVPTQANAAGPGPSSENIQ